MGVNTLPSLDDYWAMTTKCPQVASIMSSKRFRLLRRMIHFNDNSKAKDSSDRFFKVRPSVESIRKTCLSVAETNRQSIDEVMVAYKGRTAGNLRQYIKSKPTKWGYKLFSRASDDGFIHDMIMYQGQTTFSSHDVSLEEDETAQAISTRVGMTLARTMRSKSSVIYADNFFFQY